MFFQFEFTPTFGPLYKMMQRMFIDLVKFLVLWIIQLVCFSSVATLMLGSLPSFSSFNSSVLYFCEAGLGQYKMNRFHQTNDNLENFGQYFHIFFLVINGILMMNLIIAIMSSSYATMKAHNNGLYCDSLIKSFATSEWNDRYGCLACANTPF